MFELGVALEMSYGASQVAIAAASRAAAGVLAGQRRPLVCDAEAVIGGFLGGVEAAGLHAEVEPMVVIENGPPTSVLWAPVRWLADLDADAAAGDPLDLWARAREHLRAVATACEQNARERKSHDVPGEDAGILFADLIMREIHMGRVKILCQNPQGSHHA